MSYELDFMPVGEKSSSGDAILFRFWNSENGETAEEQKICLIDGGYTENGKAIEEHIKKYYNTTHIDLVISTHPDSDHIGGLSYIIENLEVDELWIHRPWLMTDGLSDCFEDGRITDNSLARKIKEGLSKAFDLVKLAESKDIKIKDPFSGETAFDEAIRVLSPSEDYYKDLLKDFRCTPEPANEDNKSLLQNALNALSKIIPAEWGVDYLENNPKTTAENNSSVVLLLKIDNKYCLLTSDAGVLALNFAADELESLGLESNCAEYIQLPHHGSKHNVDTQILNRLIGESIKNNDAAIRKGIVSISKESDNKHPSKAVLNAFKQRGVNVCKTKGSNLVYHSNDIPMREGYTKAQSYDFFEELEVTV